MKRENESAKRLSGKPVARYLKKIRELQGIMDAKNLVPGDKTTLEQFMDRWLRDYKRPTVSPNTYDWYVAVKKAIYEEIKAKPLTKVTSYEIQVMLNAMKNKGRAVRGIKATFDLLNQVYKAALEFQMVAENPMDRVKITRKETHKPKALTPDERKLVLQTIESSPTYKPIIYTMMGMGLRIGETLALKWDDIDFKENTLRVDKSAKRTPIINDEGDITGRTMEISGTKTVCSVRTLPIPQVVRSVLWEWRIEYLKRFKSADTGNLVFPNQYGKLRRYDGLRQQVARFLKEKGCPVFSFHQYRHTFATMMLERSVNPRVVQEFLGHKDITTTLGIYTTVTSAVMKEAADGADEAIRRMM